MRLMTSLMCVMLGACATANVAQNAQNANSSTPAANPTNSSPGFSSGSNNSFNNNTITGNCNAIGNNNHIVCNSPRSEFTDQLGDQLVQSMPDKSKPVVLMTIGGNKDQMVGSQVERYLRSHGYSVQRGVTGMMVPPPDQFITLEIDGKQYTLQVAPSAH